MFDWRRRGALVGVGLLLLSGQLPAQVAAPDAENRYAQVLELSIEDAVLRALSGNRELRVQRLEPVITGAFEAIARSRFDPEVFAEFDAGEEQVAEVDRGTQQQFNVAGRDYDAAVGVRQTLPTGTDIEAGIRQDRNISDRTPEQQSARFGLSLTQALLRGFGPAANLAAVRQARLETEASLFELRGFTEALVARIERTYWRYVLAHESIAIVEESLEIARRQRDAIEQRIAVGDLPRNEIAAVQAELALRQSALIDARSSREALRLELVRLINPGARDRLDIDILPRTRPEVDVLPAEEPDVLLRLVDRYRADIREARLRLEQDRLEVVQTRNGLLPRLDLFITLGVSGYANTFEGSFENVDTDTYDVRAGLVFSRAIGNRSARARDRAARASMRQAEEALANLQQLARFDVLSALNELRRAREQIDATAAVRAFSEQTVSNEEERFQVGASTVLQVALAQRDLLESRIAEVEARVDYRIAQINLFLAEGSLLERRGIRIEDRGMRSADGGI